MNNQTLLNIFSKLNNEKITINWNKNPIKMELFLSFLTIPFKISNIHLGFEQGWTRRTNKELGLVIRGGLVGGNEWLDKLEFGKKLANPFYLFDIMNKEGKDFFIEYYKDDINKIILDQEKLIISTKNKLKIFEEELINMHNELKSII